MKRITIKNSADKQLACAAINMLDERDFHEVLIDTEILTIGPFALSPFPKPAKGDPPSYWLEHESGEGMQVWADQMEKAISEIWKEF